MGAPKADEIEISIFGRGHGESILIHTGEGRWIIVDSLFSESQTSIPLDYLASIGVSHDQIDALLLTHWHDDHIGGAEAIVRAAKTAVVALPLSFNNDEFLSFLDLSHPIEGENFSSGVSTLRDVMAELKAQKKSPHWCLAGMRVSGGPSDGYQFEALSPSHSQVTLFLNNVPDWLHRQAKGSRMADPKRNDTSVASVLTVDKTIILLGADLENKGSERGWPEVHANAWKARGLASFFKLPHHGSKTGHYGKVWTDMLIPDVFSALAPYNRGAKIPSSNDIKRILSLTSNAFATSPPFDRASIKRMALVEGIIRQKGVAIKSDWGDLGQLRFRRKRSDSIERWNVEFLGNGAASLQRLAA